MANQDFAREIAAAEKAVIRAAPDPDDYDNFASAAMGDS